MTKIATTATGLRDKFLIAMPALHNSFFSHTLTYICDHTPEGAMGLVINAPLDIRLEHVFDQLGVADNSGCGQFPVLAGGPVEMGRGFVIHTPDKQWESTLAVSPELCLTTSKDIIEAIAHGHGPRKFLITLGYAGWGPGQLDSEMADNAWLTVDASPELVFDTPLEERWHLAARQLGIDLNLISSVAGHA
jgi:putative transcriptional regulator